MGEVGATLSHVGEADVLLFFTLVSTFQVCWVLAPISKAILKHIKSENKWSRAVAEEGWLGKDCFSWRALRLGGSEAGLKSKGLAAAGEGTPTPGHRAPAATAQPRPQDLLLLSGPKGQACRERSNRKYLMSLQGTDADT